jgi:hypothetical protein
MEKGPEGAPTLFLCEEADFEFYGQMPAWTPEEALTEFGRLGVPVSELEPGVVELPMGIDVRAFDRKMLKGDVFRTSPEFDAYVRDAFA